MRIVYCAKHETYFGRYATVIGLVLFVGGEVSRKYHRSPRGSSAVPLSQRLMMPLDATYKVGSYIHSTRFSCFHWRLGQ